MTEITVHGVNYIRTGSCKRCGECEKPQCPHYHFEDGLAFCDVYDKRVEVCESCTNAKGGMWYKKGEPITHTVCCSFPNHPFLRVIKEGLCGFKFEPETEVDKKKHQRLIEAWK